MTSAKSQERAFVQSEMRKAINQILKGDFEEVTEEEMKDRDSAAIELPEPPAKVERHEEYSHYMGGFDTQEEANDWLSSNENHFEAKVKNKGEFAITKRVSSFGPTKFSAEWRAERL